MHTIPRRADMRRWTPAEQAIFAAKMVVEGMVADPRLTEAVVALSKAQDFVADFVDGRDSPAKIVLADRLDAARKALGDYRTALISEAGLALQQECHGAALRAGWWQDLHTGESLIGKRNVPEMLCLIHSEISEAMEGHRKGLMDDKLPHRKMLEVELADAVIRIFDLAGSEGFDLGGAIAEKMAFNATRPDHKREARLAAGGKAF